MSAAAMRGGGGGGVVGTTTSACKRLRQLFSGVLSSSSGGGSASGGSASGGSGDLLPPILKCAGALNAYTALQAHQAGFDMIYVSGGGVALGSMGYPDLGITTLDDVLTDVRRITRVVPPTTPLLVDIDTGFGTSQFAIKRAIKDMISAGAAAVHIEDQVLAKRCGHRPNKAVVSTEEMCARISAAVEARTDPDFVIMARTDALAVEGIDSALERAKAYVDAGADAIFPEALTELEQYKAFREKLGPTVPILANMTEFGKTPLYTGEQLKTAGATLALYPLSAFRAQSRAAAEVYAAIINDDGNARAEKELMHTREQTYAVIDYHAYEKAMDDAEGS